MKQYAVRNLRLCTKDCLCLYVCPTGATDTENSIIDVKKCLGCGLCADACHEGAIGMVDGKARLLREDYCDGLGDCLPACPTGAISFEER